MLTIGQVVWLWLFLVPVPGRIVLLDGRMIPIKGDFAVRTGLVQFRTDRGYLVSLSWERVDVQATYQPKKKVILPKEKIYRPVRKVPWHLPRFRQKREIKNGEIVILDEDLKRVRSRREKGVESESKSGKAASKTKTSNQ